MVRLISCVCIFLLSSQFLSGQEVEEESLGQMVDRLTYAWDEQEEELEYYDGLMNFCQNKEYRAQKIDLLNEIHHLDSILYARAKIAQKRSNDKEIDKLIHQIEKFESKYSMKSFLKFLQTECKAQKSLERENDELQTEFGSESYDGQIYLIEVEMQKYVKHITKRIDHIRKHVHKLNIQ